MSCVVIFVILLPLDEAIASRAVFVVGPGTDGRAGGREETKISSRRFFNRMTSFFLFDSPFPEPQLCNYILSQIVMSSLCNRRIPPPTSLTSRMTKV